MYKKCALHSENRRQVWPRQNRGDGCLFYTGRRPGIKQAELGLLGAVGILGSAQTGAPQPLHGSSVLPKTDFWLEHLKMTQRLLRLPQTTTNPTDGAAATCCEGWNTHLWQQKSSPWQHSSLQKVCFSCKQEQMLVLSVISVNRGPNFRCAAIERESEENKTFKKWKN